MNLFRRGLLAVAMLASGASMASASDTYFARQKLVVQGVSYSGTWQFGAGQAGYCVGGQQTTTFPAVCSSGSSCDPAAKPADKTTTVACRTSRTCPAMTSGMTHSGSTGTAIANATFSTAAQTALDGHAICESITGSGWCVMRIPATAKAGDQIPVYRGTGGSYLTTSDKTSYATFTCN